jgi:hypothetical protein
MIDCTIEYTKCPTELFVGKHDRLNDEAELVTGDVNRPARDDKLKR